MKDPALQARANQRADVPGLLWYEEEMAENKGYPRD